ncbi:MAG: OmpH family outer membrane protein [Treponema sp.]|jgi:outer membrane protein|nr:OmpH family outer membrane protein [Treponema sp.]
MKRFGIAALLLGGALAALGAQQSVTRFAVVDMNRVVAALGAQSSDAARAANERNAAAQAEINRLGEEIAGLKDQLETAQREDKKSQINDLQKQISSKEAALKRYMAALQKEQAGLQASLRNDEAFLTRLNGILRAVAESEGYSMVLSKQEGSGILWVSPSVDITNKVLERLKGRR